MDALRELELNAYSSVLKAFMAGPVDEWVSAGLPGWALAALGLAAYLTLPQALQDKEEVMTKLRALWHIDNDAHMVCGPRMELWAYVSICSSSGQR